MSDEHVPAPAADETETESLPARSGAPAFESAFEPGRASLEMSAPSAPDDPATNHQLAGDLAEPDGEPGDDGDGEGDGGSEGDGASGMGGAAGPRKRRRGSRGGRNRSRARRPLDAGASDDGDDDGDDGDDDRDEDGGTEAELVLDADDLDEIAIARRLSGLRPSESPEAMAPGEQEDDDEDDATADSEVTSAALVPGRRTTPQAGVRVGETRPSPPPPPRRTPQPSPSTIASPSGTQKPAARSAQPGESGSPGLTGPSPAGATSSMNANDASYDDDTADNSVESGAGAAKRRRRKRGGRGRTRSLDGRATALDGPISVLEEIDDDLLERRRGRSRNGRPTGRYTMAVHVQPGHATQVAVLEGRQLVEHYVSRPTDDTSNIFGNIYLGRVQNVLPGMEAAFIDIGTPKNGVLYRGDVAYDQADFEGERPSIEKVLRNGQSVMVQVTKNPIAHKGARLAQEVSLAGRFVVMVPGQPQTFGISKRLPDDERKRLRKILDDIRPPDAGLIVRTAAEGGTRDELERDLRRLAHQWKQISDVAGRSKAPKLLHKEPELAIRIIREEFNKEYRGIYIDDPAIYEEIRSYVESVSPELAERVELYDEPLPLFERFHVNDQLAKALDRKVWLPSGGSLVIERTEALTVIDVNTGKNVGTSNLEETVYRNNLEAAEEVARQLRLRDVGGIIVIDFIDMEIKKNRDDVMRVFRNALGRDKTRTQVFEISELGLVEMTRKRVAEDLLESFSHSCPECHGRGFTLDESLLELS